MCEPRNWTAVALDFVIVVMGVFVRIQVSNWNEERQERATEWRYLERLLADTQANARALQINIDIHRRRAAILTALELALRNGSEVPLS